MKNKLQEKLNKRKQEGTLRSLSDFTKNIDFQSNNYLSLKFKLNKKVVICEQTSSRLIAGNSIKKEQIETELADFYVAESSLVYNSGYIANLGFFSSVPEKEDIVLYDQHIHASIRDGLRLGLAKSFGFEHNSLEDLEQKLKKYCLSADNLNERIIYVVTESLFSMHGDMAPLGKISQLCEKYGAYFIVDEAHACGVFGEQGRGLVHAFNLQEKVFARIVTFGKAYGKHGAIILGSKALRNYLINFSRPFIYTTAPSLTFFKEIQSAVFHKKLFKKQIKLQKNIAFFRDKLNLDSKSEVNSPIQIIKIGDIEKCKALETKLQSQNFGIKSILPPTVKVEDICLRISIHAGNNFREIKELCEQINLFFKP